MSNVSGISGQVAPRERRLPGTLVVLVGLLALLAVGAIQGGWAMVTDPLQPLGMSVSYLEEAPIDDYFWAGVFLLAIAGASLLTISGLVFDWRWSWAKRIEARIGYRWPWLGALSIGLFLLVFEVVELFMVPFHPLMHPLLIAGSLAIIGLVWSPSTRAKLRADV